MWHNIVFWVVTNFTGITLEALGDQLSNISQVKQFEVGFPRGKNFFTLLKIHLITVML